MPQPAFDSLAFGNLTPKNGFNNNVTSGLQFENANEDVTRIINAVAAGGTILSIDPPGTNASWTSQMELPRLSCAALNDTMRKSVEDNMYTAIYDSFTRPTFIPGTGPYLTSVMFAYLAWISTADGDWGVPFEQQADGSWRLKAQSDLFTTTSYQYLELFMAVIPRANNYSIPEKFSRMVNNTVPQWDWDTTYNSSFTELFDWYMEDATFLNCRLGAANYTLDFKYRNQEQAIMIADTKDIDLVAPTSVLNFEVNENDTLLLNSGNLISHNDPTSSANTLRSVSYMAIFQGLLTILLGGYSYGHGYLGAAQLGNETYSTEVFTTTLVNTPELLDLSLWRPTAANISNATEGAAYTMAASLLAPVTTDTNPRWALKDALEELFFNVTISMASKATLQ